MKLNIDADGVTTEDVKAVIQRECDKARNEDVSVNLVSIRYGEDLCVKTPPDQVEFYAGKWVAVRKDENWVYIPVSRILNVEFSYTFK